MTTDGGSGARLPSLGPRGEGWVAGQMLLIFVEGVVSYPSVAALPPETAAGWASLAVGAVLLLAGGWALVRGMGDLGRGLTPLPAPRDGAVLVEHGIYRRMRHPIYAGVMALAVGWAFAVGSLPALVVAVLLVGWLDLKSRREEAWLLARHPAYAAYRARTSRFLPGVY